MPLLSSLKSSCTREKKSLLKEKGEAQDLLQQELSDDVREIGRFVLLIGKVLLNLVSTPTVSTNMTHIINN